ncbi:MAG: hypothetical protein HOQ37_22945 [Cupriavidus sp.]|nr:hypothetical protein [Cupriavidus sp.]
MDEGDTIAVMQIEAGPALALSGGGDARRGRISPSAVSLVPAIGDGRRFFLGGVVLAVFLRDFVDAAALTPTLCREREREYASWN